MYIVLYDIYKDHLALLNMTPFQALKPKNPLNPKFYINILHIGRSVFRTFLVLFVAVIH